MQTPFLFSTTSNHFKQLQTISNYFKPPHIFALSNKCTSVLVIAR